MKMPKRFLLFFVLPFFLLTLIASPLYAADGSAYYARCNIRDHGDEISKDNWLADPIGIPAGAKITVKGVGVLVRDFNGVEMTERVLKAVLEDGRNFKISTDLQDKYLQKEPLILTSVSQDIQDGFKKGEVVVGMTKEHVWITLCNPAYVIKGMVTRIVTSAEKLTLDDIKGFDLWVYKRKRIGKKFWVQFSDKGVVEKVYWGVL